MTARRRLGALESACRHCGGSGLEPTLTTSPSAPGDVDSALDDFMRELQAMQARKAESLAALAEVGIDAAMLHEGGHD